MQRVFFFLLPLFSISVNAQTEKGLVAKYTFNNGTPHDEVGNNDAKIIGASLTKDRFGNRRSAYFFQGNYNSYMNLGTNAILKPTAGTISLWFEVIREQYNGGGMEVNPIIITKSHNGDDFFEGYSLMIDLKNSRLVITTSIDQQHQIGLRSAEAISMNEWYHVAFAYNDKYLWLYLNGVLQNDGKPILKNFRSQFLPSDSVMIAHTANCKNERFLCGSADDIFIYDRVLSPLEVAELYHAPDPNLNHLYLKWFYAISTFILLVAGITWFMAWRFKKKLQKQREKDELDMRLSQLETRAIRSQMNPHFVFNALNTLQRFILEDNKQKAQIYLADFSALLRKLLESSEQDMISLKEEIDILKTYINIEKLRFDDSFEYEVKTTVAEINSVHIPFMLLQPFVENAIWHGLLPKKTNRLLNISFSDVDEKRICCVIQDNGVGRNYKVKETNTVKKKSLAIDYIRQRLNLLQISTGIECSLEINDLKNEDHICIGTQVKIIIPKLN
jgi:hypothetical protein